MLRVGVHTIPQHAKASVFSALTSLRLQYFQIGLFLGVIQFFTDTFAAGFSSILSPTAIGFRIQSHGTIITPLDFKETRFAFVVSSILRDVSAGKPQVFLVVVRNSSLLSSFTSSSMLFPLNDM